MRWSCAARLRLWRALLASTALLTATTTRSTAQVPFEACLDRLNRPIPGIVDNTIHNSAEATRRDGQRVIPWNAKEVARVSRTAQLFIYLHECGHHTLGHLSKGENPLVEREADCWAIQLMVDGGMINGSELHQLDLELHRFRSDRFHLGGQALLESLQSCSIFAWIVRHGTRHSQS
jgi:hypothetical protein